MKLSFLFHGFLTTEIPVNGKFCPSGNPAYIVSVKPRGDDSIAAGRLRHEYRKASVKTGLSGKSFTYNNCFTYPNQFAQQGCSGYTV